MEAALGLGIQGYVCTPHGKQSGSLVETWKKDENIREIYFGTATFSEESIPYFPNRANNYIIASFHNASSIADDIAHNDMDKLSFMFRVNAPLFERNGVKLNYVSLYFTKYSGADGEIGELANVIARRDKVKRASMAQMQLVASQQPRFTFPYSKNLVILEVEGVSSHQTDQKYCERTRREVARKGIALTNLVSFSILEKLK